MQRLTLAVWRRASRTFARRRRNRPPLPGTAKRGWEFGVRKNLRIAMVAARYYPFLGGIETHIHEVGKRMVALGHHVVVLTTDPSGVLPQCEVNDGINVKRVKAWPKNRD